LSEEYQEVTDFKKIGIIVGVTISVIIGLFLAGVFTPEFLENISQVNIENIELPKIELPTEITIPPIINEIIKKGDDSKPIDQPIPETKTQNELLLLEFLRLGLEEEDITDVLTDDCSNYQNSTSNESKFQKLFDVKKELCFGVEGE